MQQPDVIVIGAGIAGCEAAWQAARLGASVALYEMRPERQTPMHSTPLAGELIGTACLGMDTLDRATGLLMSELRAVGSLIADAADKSRIGGVGLFEVGRRAFAQAVTPRVRCQRAEHRR